MAEAFNHSCEHGGGNERFDEAEFLERNIA
ncbi:MAG: hypothetical protein KatS3mg085_542 [Candidatus Dojkabacteria bacterium]|nr:MAG: hypothetical protein KatS3mg085_542 [Candidatus Dojkabacteria bacterium]